MVSAQSAELPQDLSRSRAVAVRVVAHACGLARRVQEAAVGASGGGNGDPKSPVDSLAKADLSPVTVADFAVQAYISLALAHAFPADRIIAEETSAALRADPSLLAAVVAAAAAALAPHPIGRDDVLRAIDRCGGSDGPQKGRCWILDPIDGTRGFVARRQYCVALGLTVDGVPVLGTLGCPALPLRPQDVAGDVPNKTTNDAFAAAASSDDDDQIGVVFHAVTSHGAYALSVRDAVAGYRDPLPGPPPPPKTAVFNDDSSSADPTNTSAFVDEKACYPSSAATAPGANSVGSPQTGLVMGEPVRVDDQEDPAWAVFCESVEARHSSHELSARVASLLGVKATPTRMDSQTKYGAMSRGSFHIFMRFPKKGYVENVWDHAAGQVVVTEAGGKVTDGRGRPLNFALGRHLDNDDGIVATNGRLHDAVIAAVQKALSDAI